jgi:glycosyltransferase involved in cell wall biosynthesis
MAAIHTPHCPPRAVFLNNEILPYRIPLFTALHNRSDLETIVLFSTARSRERDWRIDPAGLAFPHRVLPGICLRPPKSYMSEKRSIFINPTLFLELVRLHPDIIVAYEFSIPSMTALLYARLTGRLFLVWSECTSVSDRHLTRGQRWTRRIIIPRAQGFFGTSPQACRNLIALGAPPERVIEAPQVHQVKWIARQVAQAPATKDPSKPVILYVGSLIERKGVGLLLEAFSLVSAKHSSARLRILGNGPLRKKLEGQAVRLGVRDRVDFRGFVEPADIPFEYALADLFVLPSLEDTFAVVVVEAMASGVPVVCSPLAGVSSYLRDGEDAFVADPNDIEIFADRIGRLLDDHALRIQFAERGREIADRFEAESVAEVFAGELLKTAGRVDA